MPSDQHAILVIDLAFGDSGKGSIVDFLARRGQPPLVVRFNGGPQAGHNVVTADGRHHTFSQFGSATFVPGSRTFLSRFMLIEPYAMLNEAEHLHSIGSHDALSRLLIDENCPIITPCHQAANRLHELARGADAHGTCGMGVGEVMQDLNPPVLSPPPVLRGRVREGVLANGASSTQPPPRPSLGVPGEGEKPSASAMLFARDLVDRPKIINTLGNLRDLKIAQLRDAIRDLRGHPKASFAIQTLLDPAWLETAADHYAQVASRAYILNEPKAHALLRDTTHLLFEGAQGVLLDESFGFHPHTTWSTTTFANAHTLLREAGFEGRQTRLGVLRTYFTRHGPGPFVTEDSQLRRHLLEPHNDDAGWQGAFRVGTFDAVAARYAIAVAGGVDALAITHLDRPPQLPPRICNAYRYDGSNEHLIKRDGVVVDLRPSAPHDFPARERLTRALRECRPIHQEFASPKPHSILPEIEREVGAAVAITSLGPTAQDKRINSSTGPISWNL
ncbi:MAG TPA: adenylosuccinate synthetase [Humisphaera sp.]|jgi:adenylosuccinate synthase|nr:adenylosuccinate synthetase [Humisphaera sp.]